MRPRAKPPGQTKDNAASRPDSLSIHRAFVLRLYPGATAAQISGRLEHVVSGETREFLCINDLLQSIGQLLQRAEP
jgi:hypothetical protein